MAMELEGNEGESSRRSLWGRLSAWLGLDTSDPVDLLQIDPARHFQEWDRDLPSRYWG